jgi:hypothetical protein
MCCGVPLEKWALLRLVKIRFGSIPIVGRCWSDERHGNFSALDWESLIGGMTVCYGSLWAWE